MSQNRSRALTPETVRRILVPAEPSRRAEQEERVRDGFWDHLRRFASRIPFVEDVVAAYYCALDPKTPWKVKGILLAALAYFVLPIDLVPDVLAVIGLTDDIAILLAAINATRGALRPEHYEQARAALRDDDAIPDPAD